MRTKTESKHRTVVKIFTPVVGHYLADTRKSRLFPLVILIGMVCAILLLDAVLPLNGFWFTNIELAQLNSAFLLPTHLLFPGWAIAPPLSSGHMPHPPPAALGWAEVPLLFMAFLSIFLLYLLALHRLPQLINKNYILYTTLLLGLTYILIPFVTSPDIYSYISYARMGVIHHLNPLTTLPTTIRTDPVFIHVYWINQPSAYGPTWAGISSLLQVITLIFGSQSLLPMILALRLFGLAMHLSSTLLIWSISGYLQRSNEKITTRRRLLATLAFAWNPLLLFEACVNGHNDAALLLFILLAIWFLLPRKQPFLRGYIVAAALLALATCLKLNIVLLMPLLIIFLWKREAARTVLVTIFTYVSIIILLYAPFWQNGAILNVFHANPTTSRNINSLPEFLTHLFNGIMGVLGYPVAQATGSPAEVFTHTISIVSYIILYTLLCWQVIRARHALNTLTSLLRWLALAWLLYCAVGTPWVWPWYTITFFGLYALVEVTSDEQPLSTGFHISFATRLLAFSMLCIYCFYVWGIQLTSIPGLPGFEWTYLRGLWAWTLPLLAWRWHQNSNMVQIKKIDPQ